MTGWISPQQSLRRAPLQGPLPAALGSDSEKFSHWLTSSHFQSPAFGSPSGPPSTCAAIGGRGLGRRGQRPRQAAAHLSPRRRQRHSLGRRPDLLYRCCCSSPHPPPSATEWFSERPPDSRVEVFQSPRLRPSPLLTVPAPARLWLLLLQGWFPPRSDHSSCHPPWHLRPWTPEHAAARQRLPRWIASAALE